HDRGVAHGAVTPSNVLLDADGNAYLADFPIGTREASPAGDRRALQDLARELLGASAGAGPDGGVAVALPDGAEPPGASRNPYKGLRPFTEIDAEDFFGRRGLVGRLVALLNDDGPGSRFLAVVGPSGSGKSSVVRAGLVPAILAGAVGVLDRCVIATMHPGVHPIEELESALLAVASQRPPNLLHQLESGPRGLLDVAAAVAPPDAEILLVVDQFEEAFTLTRREEERELFLEALRVAAADPSSRLRVVVTLRADHFDRPLAHPRFAELLGARHVTVPPLTADEMEQAIRLPAEGVGARPDPGLVAAIVSDVANQPGALPLVQHALTEIFQRRVDGRLTLEAYAEIGGVGGALSATADRLVDDIAPGRRELVRQIFLRLVTLGEGRPDTRRRVARSELTMLDADPEPIEAILDAFGRHRLLTFDREPATREPTVEIAHEALLTGWARLRGWIDAAREDLRRERRLARAAAEWHAAGRDPSFLMSGARLEQLEAWASTTTVALGLHEREYLAASTQLRERREAEDRARAERERGIERRSQRRLRGLVAVLAVGALVASGLTVVATREREEASRQSRLATGRELAASSVANLEVDPERSILLALEAIRTTRAADGTVLPEAEEALHRAMTASRVVLSVPDIGGAVDWNPDGSTFVTEGPDESGIVDVRDAVTGASVLAFPGHDLDVNMAVFAPDGATLATTGDDGDVRVWDAGTGDEVWGFDGPTGVVRVPSFSPDGSLLAAPFADEGVVRVWNIETRELVQELRGLGPEESTAFSADGRRLAVTSWTGAVVVVDVTSGDRVVELDAGNDVLDVDWSPDGRWIATGDRGGIVRIWDARSFEGRRRLFGHTDEVTTVDWSPDSSRIVTGGADGFAKVWRIRDDATEELFSFSTGGGGIYATFSPDGRSVLTGEQSIGRATIWDVGIRGDAELANVPVPGLFGGVTFMADGAGVAASNGDGSVTIWDPATGDGIATLGRRDPSFGPLHGGRASCVIHTLEPSPDGDLLAGAGLCTPVFDVATGETVYDHVAPVGFTTDVAWAPGGDLLAIAEGDRDVTIVDRTGERVGEVSEEPDFFIEPAAFSADGELLATGRLRETRPDPDATRVAVWDWRRGELVTSIPAWPMSLAFAPTGDRIAIASLFSVAEIWDARTGAKLATLSGHRGVVNDVAFGPDGSTVATAGSDGTVRIWDAATGALRLTLRGHHGAVTDVAFSPDGTMLVSSGRDGVGRIWALELDALIGLARDELTRGFTEDECRRFLHRPCAPADDAAP
ncbi:MAG TPA: AAA family ATPase, partial [Actinomycetota bacterium]